jgi:HSP20 family protein
MEDGTVLVLHADLIEAEDEYIVVAEMPGVPRKKVELRVSIRGIQICGECECDRRYVEKGAIFLKRELLHTKACRYLRFTKDVDADKTVAKLEGGLLEIRVPKALRRPKRRGFKPRRKPIASTERIVVV